MTWVSAFRLRRAAQHLRRGGLLAYPTEAVYGLGCNPLDGGAVFRLLRLKRRSVSKGLILLAADFSQIEPFLLLDSAELRETLLERWPGPVTWVVPAQDWVPRWLCRPDGTLAVRVTAHGTAAALCRAFGGPIVSTSANPGKALPARSAVKVARYFRGAELAIFQAALGGQDKPTDIFDARTRRKLR